MKNERSRISILPLLAFFLACLALPLRAQESKIDLSFLDFSAIAAETVDVTLDGQMLRLALKFLAEDPDDKEVAQLVGGLSGIYVRSFTFDGKGSYSKSDVDRVRSQLGAGWSRIITSKSREGEDIEVWVRSKNDRVAGLVILSAEPNELTVVNLVGEIDLDKLSRLENQFGIPAIPAEAKQDAKTGARQ
ncbi:MAG: DUF4252 domain-containing protein [Thermoanaerobaculia bacterium]